MNTSYTARRRFTVTTFVIAIVLLAWGAFVTSINAGLAVPDWPSSFDSYDPFNPWPNWWTVTPVLAEHGHRLLGALIGMLTVVLGIWTWLADDRVWLRRLAIGAILLVITQGVLGGLRVVWVSLNLAVVHALVAQLFFALLVSMALFVSKSWRTPEAGTFNTRHAEGLSPLLVLAPAAVYIQIFFGALLRHPGTGLDPLLAGLHFGWAFVATSFVVVFWTRSRASFTRQSTGRRMANTMLGVLIVQVSIGLFAYLVLLDETGTIQPSNVQVIANTAHMVIGALLFASTVSTSVLCARYRATTIR